MSDGRRTEVRRTSDENRTKIRRTSDEQSSVAATAMAGGGAALQLLATQRCGEAGKTLQLAAMARPAECCSSLLWRGRQQVAARCCGNGQQRCNSRRWTGSAAIRDDGRQRAAALANSVFVFFILFFYLTTSRAKERERQKEKGRESL